ncbi:hypothetical protein [Arthrobacter sp. A5]|uniref:alpha/beta hydrolase n=1 Tax=Arthrobacter sp. A5 TaxID=576926 RepID=UPI003DA8C46E
MTVVEDLRTLVNAVGGTASVYGHSSGGILALEAAAGGVPITKLAVYEPPYLTGNVQESPRLTSPNAGRRPWVPGTPTRQWSCSSATPERISTKQSR